jgi:hypothetical protein
VVPFGSIPHPAKLEYFERAGVTQCVFRLPSAPESIVMPILDRYASLISEIGASA